MKFFVPRGALNIVWGALVLMISSMFYLPAHAADPTISVPNTNFQPSSIGNRMPILISNFNSQKAYSAVITVASGSVYFDPDQGEVTTAVGFPEDIADPASSHSFSGEHSEIKAVLASAKFDAGADSGDVDLNITVTETLLDSENLFFNEANGHYYLAVSTDESISWTQAKAASAAKSMFGLTGYLATLTSAQENTFVAQYTTATDVWIGAGRVDEFDADAGYVWEWKTGPETGMDFCTQETPGNCVPIESRYSAWQSPYEPNGQYMPNPGEWVECELEGFGPGSLTTPEPVEPSFNPEVTEPETVEPSTQASTEPSQAPIQSQTLVQPQADPECEDGYMYVPGEGGGWSESYGVTNWQGSVGEWNDLMDTFPVYNYLVEFGGTDNGGSQVQASATVTLNIDPDNPSPDEQPEWEPEPEPEPDPGDDDEDVDVPVIDLDPIEETAGSGDGGIIPATGSPIAMTALFTALVAMALSSPAFREVMPNMDLIIEMFGKPRSRNLDFDIDVRHPAWPTLQ